MIIFQGVTKTYKGSQGEVSAIREISFKIDPREFVSLVGKSGAGKSTIIKLLTGEEKPTKGRIIFGSYDVTKQEQDELYRMRRHIGTVFQDFKLLPEKTAYENIAFALEIAGKPQTEIDELVPRALDIVGLGRQAYNFPREMSGGEKQRVAIARAMINNPDVIIADEPTGNLDPINTAEIINLLLKINELGTTIILATHNKDIINSLKRRVISLENGEIIRDEEKGKYILF
ncbi:cell division ATP-binding protein FtsE [Candidatus Wolfebacteria bacterium RIFCSPHIGHO2_01_FULL_48_22]|uniref:Cell division ATP-binding protein FtsE n=2 Tax=Candidatus Wolfeibacteriota TaxID=1752735 RepID=A0A1F8DST3_9BACT|nr:MAG: cell division ATP-binding protein FtsE [Candidatus Wolfebacteria bacterium RIFCSPHIGHO2_01_FULL_48_22]OGM91946.1 MAG: cell division ATP-binding protein FtsE [Candidatus Wolfebacteria bacterium RIFCSPLOWO2_01_FULL_47_17b]